ncbi:hypothetical protein JYT28_00040 [Desulfobulbus sp. AH-315-M07]|nr:hypothetical protein [Desulfobulbus sp. AH-315-M07]
MRRAALLVLLIGCGKEKVAPRSDAGAPQHKTPPLAVLSVRAASETSFAWMSDGTVRAWGENGSGQLGWGDLHQDTATPVQVEGLANVDALYAGGTSGTTTVCARIKGGSVKCWGHSDLIPGLEQPTAKPVEIAELAGAKDLAIGGGHACAVHADGNVSCWGYGAFGALGLGADMRNKRAPTPMKIHGLTCVRAVAAGQNHTCVLHADGGVSCWGGNFEGQADPKGSGTLRGIVAPLRVEGVADVVAIAAGSDLTCALGKDSNVKCWGENFRGAVGELPSSSGTKALWSGFGDHACIIRNKGDLWCWGDNAWGQAGGELKTRKIPEPTLVPEVSEVTSVATGFKSKHTCAGLDGAVSCWGRNRFGALGDGTLVDRRQPQEVVDVISEKLPAPRDGRDTVKASGEKTAFDALPDGCAPPRMTAVRFKGVLAVTEFEVVHAEAVRRPRKTADGNEGTRYVVTLRNYPFDARSRGNQRGRQVKLTLAFEQTHMFKEEGRERRSARPVDVGAFQIGRLTGEDRRELKASGTVRRHRFDFLRGGEAYAGATITHLGDHWICGNISLKNGDNVLIGEFAAPLRAK